MERFIAKIRKKYKLSSNINYVIWNAMRNVSSATTSITAPKGVAVEWWPSGQVRVQTSSVDLSPVEFTKCAFMESTRACIVKAKDETDGVTFLDKSRLDLALPNKE